jgi:hypothetical protein
LTLPCKEGLNEYSTPFDAKTNMENNGQELAGVNPMTYRLQGNHLFKECKEKCIQSKKCVGIVVDKINKRCNFKSTTGDFLANANMDTLWKT